MMKKLYEIPESELLLVKFEENFCNSPYDRNGTEKGNERDGGEEGFFFE